MGRDLRERPELIVGDIVISTSGRGGGRYYIVIDVVDHEYVKISDGANRKIDKPKLKKNLHLIKIGEVEEKISFTDASIIKILKEV